MDAARHWALGGVKDETADDLLAFGATVAVLQTLPDENTEFGVWEENAESVAMFMRLQTQWNVTANGVFLGLNYQAADVLFRIHAVTDQAAMMNDLQAMEIAALNVLNARG